MLLSSNNNNNTIQNVQHIAGMLFVYVMDVYVHIHVPLCPTRICTSLSPSLTPLSICSRVIR